MTRTKRIVNGICILLIAGLLWYWLSGELFRPHGTTTVELTAVYPDGRPARNAHFDFTQSGVRVIIPIPFASIGRWQTESKFSQTADINGHCRFTFFDQICQLDSVNIDEKQAKVIGNMEVRGTNQITLNSSRPTWLATPQPYVHRMVVSPPELQGARNVDNSMEDAQQAVPSDGHKPSSRVPSDGPTAPADAH